MTTRYYNIVYNLSSLWSITYGIHLIVLGMLFYFTITFVFNDTAFSISKCTQKTYKIIFILSGFCVVLIAVISPFSELNLLFSLVVVIVFLVYIIVMTSLTILFVKKLIIVYRNTEYSTNYRNSVSVGKNGDDNGGLVAPITRLTILISVSLSMSFLLIIFEFITAFNYNGVTLFMSHSIGLINLYTNFVTAMLTNKIFDGYYKKICGMMDELCRKCCMKIVHREEDKLADIVNDKSVSSVWPSRGTGNLSVTTPTTTDGE